MYDRILVPLDGSPTAAAGLGEALKLARAMGSTLVLLHVIEDFPVAMEMASAATWEAVTSGLRENGSRVLDEASARASAQGVKAETVLHDAGGLRVCDLIVDAATAQKADLIAMGTHGRRGVQHALIGSDAERVLRQAPVPVLMTRAA